jgi:hypothetical protein
LVALRQRNAPPCGASAQPALFSGREAGMGDRRDRSAEVHTKDGVLRRGRLLGYSDAQGRVREADGTFRKGEELGQVDAKHRVRRKGSLVGRGEVVGRIKGNALFGRPGLLATPKKLGYVDAEGNVWQCDCAAFRGRVVGKTRGADPEAGLAYFLLKFQTVADHVQTLEEKVRASTDKFAFLPRVRAMLKVLPEVDALGDFDDVVRRLEQLEQLCAEQLDEHFERQDEPMLGIRDSVARLGEAASLEVLRAELNLAGRDGIEKAEALVGKVAGRLRRGERKSVPPPEVAHDDRAIARPASLPPEMYSPLEAILASTLGPMEKLREEVDRVRRDPEFGADELWDRVRTTVASLMEYRDMTAAMMGRMPAGLPASGPLLPPPPPLPDSVVTEPERLGRAVEVKAEAGVELEVFEDDEPTVKGSREHIEKLLDSPAASQVFGAIDGAILGFASLRRAREGGVQSLKEAMDEGVDGLRALAQAREDGAAGLRFALERLKELRRARGL